MDANGEIGRGRRHNPRCLLALVALAALAWGGVVFGLAGRSGSAHAQAGAQFNDEDLVMVIELDGTWYNVAIQMLMQDDGSGDYAAQVAAAKAGMLARFPGAIEATPGEVGAQYVLNPYWWPAHATSWRYNSAGKPGALSGDQAAIASGATAWGGVGANWSFSGGSTTTAGTGACSGGALDGVNTVGWAAQSGSVLAVTCTWYNGGSPGTAVEFDMQIDPDWSWTTGSPVQIDLASVSTHEFGHALGLGHTADGSAVMYASYSSGSTKRSPLADDISGIKAIYGATGGGGSTPTNTPTRTPTATPTGTGAPATNTPTPTRTNTPAANTPTPTNVPGGSPPAPASTPTPVPTSGAPTPTKSPTPGASPSPSPTPTATGTPKPSLPLSPGANLLTWPGTNVPPAQAVAGQPGIQAIYGWDAASRSWKRYGAALPAFVNNLDMLRQGQAYWFVARTAAQVPFLP